MSNYPASQDTWADVANGVDRINDFLFHHGGLGVAVVVEAIQEYLGYSGDSPASAAGIGNITERVLRLEELGGARFFFQTTAPLTPDTGDFWIHTGITPWAIAYYSGTEWQMLGASASVLGGVPVDFGTPVAGYVIAYDGVSGTLQLMAPNEFNTITALGQIVVGDATGHAVALGMGEPGQFIQPREDGLGLAWQWPLFRAFQQVGLTTHGAPTVAPVGVGGSTTYTYQVVAVDARGYRTAPTATGTTTTGNATLNSSNFNRISWFKVEGAVEYHILKNGTANRLAVVSAPLLTVDDTGQTTSGYTPPVRNETLDLGITGWFRANGAVIDVAAGLSTEPAVSSSTGARIYYDQVLGAWRQSLNGAAYTDFGTAGASGHTIQSEGVDIPAHPTINFTGAGVNVSEDVGNDAIIVDVAGGGGGAVSDVPHPFILLGA
jgi:hypothetical protein